MYDDTVGTPAGVNGFGNDAAKMLSWQDRGRRSSLHDGEAIGAGADAAAVLDAARMIFSRWAPELIDVRFRGWQLQPADFVVVVRPARRSDRQRGVR